MNAAQAVVPGDEYGEAGTKRLTAETLYFSAV